MLWTPTLAAGLVQWAWMVLLAAEGLANDETAERVGGVAADGEPVWDFGSPA